MRFIRGTPKEFRWAVSGAGGYVNNSVATGEDMDGSGLGNAIWKGGVAGAISGGVGSYMGDAGWNLLGSRGAEIISGGLGGGVGSKLNGDGFWVGFAQGAAIGMASSMLTEAISPDFEYDGTDLTKAELKNGDVIGWGSDGSGVSRGIIGASGEDFSHVGIVDEDADGFFIREATGEGKQIRTEISKYSNRPYKIYGNRQITQPFVEQRTGFGFKGYNLVETNCTSQATRWTGMNYTNNPGVLYRQMNGITPFYTSSTLQGYHVW